MINIERRLVAFQGNERIAQGTIAEVVRTVRCLTIDQSALRLAFYDDATGHVLDIDLYGDEATVMERLARHPILARTASTQSSDTRYRRPMSSERRRIDAAYRFMHDLVGDIEGFEEASRALFASDATALAHATAAWPVDVRVHIDHLLSPSERRPVRVERHSKAESSIEHTFVYSVLPE